MTYVTQDTEVSGFVTRQVGAGFRSAASIAEAAAETFDTDLETVSTLVDDALAAHIGSMAAWPEMTDCDRLDRALAKLEAVGVVARQNFSCCNNCGHQEILEAVSEVRERGHKVMGYVFYHQQDTDSALGGEGLHLRYGSVKRGGEAIAEVGRCIASVLGEEGLVVRWNDDPTQTIALPDFDWKRRATPSAIVLGGADPIVERWCQSVRGAAARRMLEKLGVGYGQAAVAVGKADLALACARAAASKCQWLAAIALALCEAGSPDEEIAPLWSEAYAEAPFKGGWLVELLVTGKLSDATVRDEALEQVLQRRGIEGAAARAWYLVRAWAQPMAEEQREELFSSVERSFEREASPFGNDEAARVALAAALWLIYRRHGDDAKAEATRQIVSDGVTGLSGVGSHAYAVRAALFASAEALDPSGLAEQIETQFEWLLPEQLDHIVATGHIDDAAAFIKRVGHRERLFARLARLVPNDPRAKSFIDEAQAAESELDGWLEEGLVTSEEVRDARLEIIRLHAAQGDRRGAQHDLRTLALAAKAEVVESGAALLALLDEARSGNPDRLLALHETTEPPKAEALQNALAQWDAAKGRGKIFNQRRQVLVILEAARGLARQADKSEARALIGCVVGDHEELDTIPEVLQLPLVAALLAIDALERARTWSLARNLTPEAIALLGIHLLGLGRAEDALELLARAVERTTDHLGLIALGPAIFAICADGLTAAKVMIEAFQSGNDVMDTLIA